MDPIIECMKKRRDLSQRYKCHDYAHALPILKSYFKLIILYQLLELVLYYRMKVVQLPSITKIFQMK